MFDDILGSKNNKKIEQDTEAIMEAMKYNIEEKEKMIQDLLRQVTELERKVETMEHGIGAA